MNTTDTDDTCMRNVSARLLRTLNTWIAASVTLYVLYVCIG